MLEDVLRMGLRKKSAESRRRQNVGKVGLHFIIFSRSEMLGNCSFNILKEQRRKWRQQDEVTLGTLSRLAAEKW